MRWVNTMPDTFVPFCQFIEDLQCSCLNCFCFAPKIHPHCIKESLSDSDAFHRCLFNFIIKKSIYNTIPAALIFIAENGLIHGDVKPGNILVSSRNGRLRAFVGDFGLTNKSGGTPIYMAPEGLDKSSRVLGKTDLYSFAVTTLFLLFPTVTALKLIFLPISEGVKEFRRSLQNLPLLGAIFDTLVTDPHRRRGFDTWRKILEGIEDFKEEWLKGKITPEIMENIGIDLSPLRSAEETFVVMDYFDVISKQLSQNQQEPKLDNQINRGASTKRPPMRVNEMKAWPMTAAVSHFEKLTLETLNNTANNLSKSK